MADRARSSRCRRFPPARRRRARKQASIVDVRRLCLKLTILVPLLAASALGAVRFVLPGHQQTLWLMGAYRGIAGRRRNASQTSSLLTLWADPAGRVAESSSAGSGGGGDVGPTAAADYFILCPALERIAVEGFSGAAGASPSTLTNSRGAIQDPWRTGVTNGATDATPVTGAPSSSRAGSNLRSRLSAALRNKHSGAAVRALQLLADADEPIGAETYHAVVSGCMRSGQWRAGLRAFNLCLEGLRGSAGGVAAVEPWPATWKAVLRGLLAAGQPDTAVAVARAALRINKRYDNGSSRCSGGGPASVVDKRLCSALLDLCAGKGRMALAEQLVELMEENSIPVGPVTYCILVKGYGRQRRAHMVDATLAAMQRNGVRPDVIALNAAIDAYVRCGNLRRARAVLRAMETNALVAPNVRSYNTMVKGLGRGGRLDEAFAVLGEMRRRGCQPNQVTLNTLVGACVRCGQLERAHDLLRSSGSPGVEAFTAVLAGYAERGDKARAVALFQRMGEAGVRPNLVTYTALITACVNCGDVDDARRLLAALEQRGLTDASLAPTVVTYNSLITGLCQATPAEVAAATSAEEATEAVTAAATMAATAASVAVAAPEAVGTEEAAAVPEPSSALAAAATAAAAAAAAAAAVAAAAAAATTSAAAAATTSAAAAGIAVANVQTPVGAAGANAAAASAASGVFAVSGAGGSLPEGVHEALQLLLTMRRKGVAPNEVTMNAILDGLVSAAPPRMKEAEAVVGLMRAWGLVPSEVSYSTLIKGYGRAGDLPAAERAFAAMLADMRTCADVAAVNCLLDACAKNGDMKRAVELLEEVCAAASARRRHSGGVGGSGGGGGGGASSSGGSSGGGFDPSGNYYVGTSGGGGSLGGVEGSQAGAAAASSAAVVGRPRLDVSPNVVSFSTVILGLARCDNMFSGRKAMALYFEMRESFGLEPDEVMIDGLLRACANSRTRRGGLSLDDGRRILRELPDLGWTPEAVARKRELLLESVMPALSEVWKERDAGGSIGKATAGGAGRQGAAGRHGRRVNAAAAKAAEGLPRKKTKTEEIFEKYDWNKIDSRFPLF